MILSYRKNFSFFILVTGEVQNRKKVSGTFLFECNQEIQTSVAAKNGIPGKNINNFLI